MMNLINMNKKMKIYANFTQEVNVDPIIVISKLIYHEINDGWVFEKNGKYYMGFESGGGYHSWDDEEEITKEKYDYVKALELIRDKLKKQIK